MKVLLDTHTFIWWDSDPSRLSPRALMTIQDPTTVVLLSVVSVWEILIKQQLGKLSLRLPLADIIAQQQGNGIGIMPVTLAHALGVEALPSFHKDPFDRLLISQAILEGSVLLSADQAFPNYPVTVLW